MNSISLSSSQYPRWQILISIKSWLSRLCLSFWGSCKVPEHQGGWSLDLGYQFIHFLPHPAQTAHYATWGILVSYAMFMYSGPCGKMVCFSSCHAGGDENRRDWMQVHLQGHFICSHGMEKTQGPYQSLLRNGALVSCVLDFQPL
jgi:hypothetical protein